MADKELEGVEWEAEGRVYEAVPRKSSVVQSVRFPRDEIEAVREAAARAGCTTSEFIRQAAVARASSVTLAGAFRLTTGSGAAQFQARSDETANVPSAHLRPLVKSV